MSEQSFSEIFENFIGVKGKLSVDSVGNASALKDHNDFLSKAGLGRITKNALEENKDKIKFGLFWAEDTDGVAKLYLVYRYDTRFSRHQSEDSKGTNVQVIPLDDDGNRHPPQSRRIFIQEIYQIAEIGTEHTHPMAMAAIGCVLPEIDLTPHNLN